MNIASNLLRYLYIFYSNLTSKSYVFVFIKINVCRSLGLAVPPRVRFLQKWKKAREAKKKEKELFAETMVNKLNEKLNKSSDSDVTDNELEPEPNRLSIKDSYNFHNGILLKKLY